MVHYQLRLTSRVRTLSEYRHAVIVNVPWDVRGVYMRVLMGSESIEFARVLVYR